MFWGLTLEHGSVYSQVVDRSFHLSMAALGFDSHASESVSVAVEVNKARYVLCTLRPNHIPHQQLNHEFTEGEELCFYMVGGSGEVHLTGFLLPTPVECEYDDLSDDTQSTTESESEDIENEVLSRQVIPLDESASYRSFLTQLTSSVGDEDNDESDDESSEEEYTPGKKKKKLNTENSSLAKKQIKKAASTKNDFQINNKLMKSKKKQKIQQFIKKKKRK